MAQSEAIRVRVPPSVYEDWHYAVYEIKIRRKLAKTDGDVLGVALKALYEKFGIKRP